MANRSKIMKREQLIQNKAGKIIALVSRLFMTIILARIFTRGM